MLEEAAPESAVAQSIQFRRHGGTQKQITMVFEREEKTDGSFGDARDKNNTSLHEYIDTGGH